MTAQQLSQLLLQPNTIHNISYEQLENVLVEYPYCGVVRLLLLKKCQLQAHPAFSQQLQLAAVYLPDRVRLHDFLKNEDNDPASSVGEIPPFPVPDNFPNQQPEEKKKTELDIIQLDGMLQKTKKKRFKLPRIPVLEDKSVLELLSGSHAELLPPKKSKESDKVNKKDRKNFFDFSPDMELFFRQLSDARKAAANGNVSRDFPELDELAQKSITENNEAISETLAELLAQQGQNERAIKMYSALSLKFPQKNLIFADRIAWLKHSSEK